MLPASRLIVQKCAKQALVRSFASYTPADGRNTIPESHSQDSWIPSGWKNATGRSVFWTPLFIWTRRDRRIASSRK